MFVEMVLIRRLYGKEPLLGLILTFALALLVEAILRLIFGGAPVPFSAPKFLSGVVEYGPILITKYRMVVLAVTVLALIAFWAFLEYTAFGRIIRAGSRDAEMVGLLGINLPIVLTGVFGVGCLLAGLAGMLAGPLWTVNPSMAAGAIMPAFVIVTIGGLGSYAGAIVAGLMVGARHRHDHPVLSRLVERGDVHPDGGHPAGAAARPVRRAVGEVRMTARSIALAIRSSGSPSSSSRSRLLWLALGAPVQLITQIAIYTLYGAGVNLLVGYTGLVPFGASVFFGTASYAAAFFLLGHFGNEFVALALSVLFSAVLGLVIGADHPAPQGPLFLVADARLFADRLRGRLQVDRRHRRRERHAGRSAPVVHAATGRSTSSSW